MVGAGFWGCASTDSSEIQGTITYRERIMLPAGSKVVVQLISTARDADSATDSASPIAEIDFRTEGEQVPLPFTVKYDPESIGDEAALAIRARIETFGTVLFETPSPQFLRGLSGVGQEPSVPVEIMLSQRSQGTPAEESATEGDDSGAGVWEDARLRGVDFRGLGQEPGWTLEIDEEKSILFVGDYGAVRREVPAVEPTVEGTVTTYDVTTESGRLTVVIEDAPCRDVMSGEPFDATVAVVLDGRLLMGCGRPLD
ncbi:MAG TPA: YbaY family lipoprotein [Gemmatimonadota bacterium]|nr:YbaY family lipoprotein [Gemmatimonadota bacterium]